MPSTTFQDTDLTIVLTEDGLEISVCPYDSDTIGGCVDKSEWDTVKVKPDQIKTLYKFMQVNIGGLD